LEATPDIYKPFLKLYFEVDLVKGLAGEYKNFSISSSREKSTGVVSPSIQSLFCQRWLQ